MTVSQAQMMRARLDAERRMRDAGITPEVLKVIDEVNELERRTGLSAEDMQVLAILGPHYTEAKHSPIATVTRGKRDAPAAGTNPQNSPQAGPRAVKLRESQAEMASTPQAASTPAKPALPVKEKAGRTNRIRRRADPLAAVLVRAKSGALDPTDWTSAWAAVVALAQADTRPAPLLGYIEGEGVKYQKDNREEPVGFLTRDAFRKRWEYKRRAGE